MKFNKKLSAGLLTGVMALSLAAPTFASGSKNTTVITATYTPITIAVTVPATGKAVINPYGLPYAMGSETITGQQITSVPLLVQNKSATALDVKATVTGAVTSGSSFDFSPTVLDENSKTKLGYVVFQMFGEEAEQITAENASETETVNALAAALPAFDATDTSRKTDIVVGTSAATLDKDTVGQDYILTLREGNEEKALQAGGAAFFRLAGNVVKAPEKADGSADPWTASDGFTTTIAFTFEPNSDGFYKEGGTIAATKADGSTALDVTNTIDGTTDNTAKVTLTLPAGLTAADVENVTWSSSDSAVATVAGVSGGLTATVTHKSGTTTGKSFKVCVTYTDKTLGLPYKAELSMKSKQ